jgi:hypothetical protein
LIGQVKVNARDGFPFRASSTVALPRRRCAQRRIAQHYTGAFRNRHRHANAKPRGLAVNYKLMINAGAKAACLNMAAPIGTDDPEPVCRQKSRSNRAGGCHAFACGRCCGCNRCIDIVRCERCRPKRSPGDARAAPIWHGSATGDRSTPSHHRSGAGGSAVPKRNRSAPARWTRPVWRRTANGSQG